MRKFNVKKYEHYEGKDGRTYVPMSHTRTFEGGEWLVVEIIEDWKFKHVMMKIGDFKKIVGISKEKKVIIND